MRRSAASLLLLCSFLFPFGTAYAECGLDGGVEACNCHEPDSRDFHVWIGPQKPSSAEAAKTMREDAIVVEPTPHFQNENPAWKLKTLQQLAKSGAKVRISGWVMYDPEHPDELGKTRASLWEIHPVHKIEVWTGDQWRAL